jgi:hypothetical protein
MKWYVYALVCALTSVVGVAFSIATKELPLQPAPTAIRSADPPAESEETALEAVADQFKPTDGELDSPGLPIPLTLVNASGITSVGYSPTNQVMEVHFNSGRVWWYYNVPQTVYWGFLKAPSHGHYFNHSITNAGFRARPVSRPVTTSAAPIHSAAPARVGGGGRHR